MAEAEDASGRVVDWFAVLGCTPEATDTEVRRAYRALARTSHPDRGGDPAEFARANRAYELLRTPEQRADLVVRLRAQDRRDALRRRGTDAPGPASGAAGPATGSRPHPAGGSGSHRAGGSRPRPAGGSGPSVSRPPGRGREGRLSPEEQDRLLGEFWASHPDVAARGSRPVPGPSPAPAPRRRGRGLRGLLLGAAAAVLVVLLAQPLLPDPVQDTLDEVVTSLLP